jgi:hypothetical protein
MLLKWVLHRFGVRVWIGYIWLGFVNTVLETQAHYRAINYLTR